MDAIHDVDELRRGRLHHIVGVSDLHVEGIQHRSPIGSPADEVEAADGQGVSEYLIEGDRADLLAVEGLAHFGGLVVELLKHFVVAEEHGQEGEEVGQGEAVEGEDDEELVAQVVDTLVEVHLGDGLLPGVDLLVDDEFLRVGEETNREEHEAGEDEHGHKQSHTPPLVTDLNLEISWRKRGKRTFNGWQTAM